MYANEVIGEPVKQDKLGNDKPVETNDENERLSRREAARRADVRTAVSPPSRRGRDRGLEASNNVSSNTDDLGHVYARDELMEQNVERRGRQFDRHSGTGLVDSAKKLKQGWGHLDTAQEDAAVDYMPSAQDPAGEGMATPRDDFDTDDDTKTLDEYKKSQKNSHVPSLPTARKPNEGGVDKSQLKDGIPLHREDQVLS
ncbi:uncharacterized protein BYT42DRAFT_562615 [Radiomyces spectabilis]|uniref:uncharacterized protein n=1 Tax=Radiomyces spectabilis TaxID=64574 RepID=UPI00221FCFB8|nr:uncharacterized protein BYT42DRAFT_562615 [Radiomyces spectabilis]KAI8384464.1 hypothetical protein BYT42DRAFT_562615 [Radiomyces spectabilis]